MAKHAVILFASVSADARCKNNTDSLQSLFENKGIPFFMTDGASPENKDVRTKLFGVSGKRAVYPQAFIRSVAAENATSAPAAADEFSFIGDFDDLSALNEGNERGGGFDAVFAGISRVAPGTALLGIASAGGIISSLATPSATGAVPTAAAASVVSSAPAAVPASPRPASMRPVSMKIKSAISSRSLFVAAPSPWVKQVSSAGEPYWWHPITKQSAWVDPTGAVAATDPSVGTGTAPVWVSSEDDGGRPYFYNFETGASRWFI